MTRDEWILKHVPALTKAVRAFCRSHWSWLSDADKEDILADALLALTQQGDRLARKGPIDVEEKGRKYVTAIAWHTCIDAVRATQNARKYTSNVKFSELLDFCQDFSVFNGYATDYNDRGSMIPMSEDMGEEELAALEDFIKCEPKNAWQRSELKRRALAALDTLGVQVDGIFTYTIRTRSGEGVFDEEE